MKPEINYLDERVLLPFLSENIYNFIDFFQTLFIAAIVVTIGLKENRIEVQEFWDVNVRMPRIYLIKITSKTVFELNF